MSVRGRSQHEIRKPHLLLVEGKDEENFFRKLLKSDPSRFSDSYQVLQVGKHSFRVQLAVIAGAMNRTDITVRSVGVIRDADESPQAALQSVCDGLGANGFQMPRSHALVVPGAPRVGAFIMPDGKNRGALETLCRTSVTGTPASDCVGEFLRCLDERSAWCSPGPSVTARRDKAFAHAYLAAGKDPVARVGEGALKSMWDFHHKAFQPITEFLMELIE